MKTRARSFLKWLLPQGLKNRLKVLISKYPYVFHPSFLTNKKENLKTLDSILKEGNYKGVIVFPPTIDWFMPLFQRPQQLAKAFAREGYLFFYCTNNLRFDKVNGFEKIEDNLFITNQIHLLRRVKNPILFISWPFNEFYISRFNDPQVIYDYIDELEVFDTSGRTIKELYKLHENLVKRSNLVVATADFLYDQIKKLSPKKVILAPNGVDLDNFNPEVYANVPEDINNITKMNKPIIGYYGAIADWFDYNLLEYCAKKRPDYSFVLIGPYDYDKTLMKNKHLFKIDNLYFLGPKKYEELPAYLKEFSVATIPFLVNKITRSTSPVKLFEYMAGAKPIVTTNMDECKKYKSVLIGHNKEEYVEKLDEALKLINDKKYKELLKREASENTWQKRAQKILESL